MKRKILPLMLLALLLLSGCRERAQQEVDHWNGVVGELVLSGLENLKNAEHQGGPFDNNLESARTYLLEQLREKYGMEFAVVGRENLQNYGPFAGASYSCEVAPIDVPEQTTMALVSQTAYQDVRDGYAVYYFKEDAEAPVLTLCEGKEYVIDQRISLEMPETAETWTPEDSLDHFLSESGAYVKLVLRFPDGLDTKTYAEYLYDFLNSVDQLECNLLLQAKADGVYIFHRELDILGGFDASPYTVEALEHEVETDQSMGRPR